MIFLFLAACGLPWGDASGWQDAPGTVSWEWILDTDSLPEPPPDVDFLGLDGADTPAVYVQTAVDQGAEAWCYLSVGTAEEYRDDYAELVAIDEAERAAGREPILGDAYPEWPDERWLNPRAADAFFHVMEARLDLCRDKGFTWVELDNMDGYDNETGLSLSADDVETYVRDLIDAARDRGLSPIHKGSTGLIEALEPEMDALLLEDCALYGFCDAAAPFVEAGKPVWDAEYPESWRDEGTFDLEEACSRGEAAGASVLIKRLDLTDATIVCAAR